MTERPELDPVLAREDGRPCSPWLLCGCSADLGCDCLARQKRSLAGVKWSSLFDDSEPLDEPESWTLSEEVAMLAGIRR